MVPFAHSIIALLLFGAVYLISHDPLAAALTGSIFYVSREFTQYQAGKGYGLWAWVFPVIACSVAYLVFA